MQLRDCEDDMLRLTLSDPDSPAGASKRAALRAAIAGSLKGCGIPLIDKEELKRKIAVPVRLRRAMAAAVKNKDPSVEGFEKGEGDEEEDVPEAPLVVFINPRSGGRQGPVLMDKLLKFLGEEQVSQTLTPILTPKRRPFVVHWVGMNENGIGI